MQFTLLPYMSKISEEKTYLKMGADYFLICLEGLNFALF